MRNILIVYPEATQDPAILLEASSARASELPDWIRLDDSYQPVPRYQHVPSGGDSALHLQSLPTAVQTPQAYVIRASVAETDLDRVSDHFGPDRVFADPQIASQELGGAPITCGTSPAVGGHRDVQTKLNVSRLHASGATGRSTALAVMDSGIDENHLRNIFPAVNIDGQVTWRPPGCPPAPGSGRHPVVHGTMCAFDALIVAPDATLLDYPILNSPSPPSGTWFSGALSNALGAYAHLLAWWTVAFGRSRQQYESLVVSNSWSMYDPNWDFPPSHPGRYQDNPNHPFNQIVAVLASHNVDILFAAGNCGSHCPDARCSQNMPHAIMGANAHPDVICVSGVDTHDQWVGYSSEGPASANMDPKKPDLAAYTHFLGSMVRGNRLPDTGTSAACPVAAGCVATLRSKHSQSVATSRRMAEVLEVTARKPLGNAHGWDRKLGHGIIDPLAADGMLP